MRLHISNGCFHDRPLLDTKASFPDSLAMNLVAINLGTLLSSHTISAVLFGVFTVQTYVYAQNFAPLNAWTKSVLATIWVLELVYVGTTTSALYAMAISPLARLRELGGEPPFTVFISAIILTMICLLVKGWLICKLGRMSLNRVLVIICTILGLAGALVAFALIGIMMHRKSDLRGSFPEYKWLIVAWLGVDIGFNAIVTGSQLYFLWCRRMSGFAYTVTVLDRAMIWTTQSGVVTTALYIAILICFFALEESWLWVGLAVLLPGVYVNAMLALLNGRKALSRMMVDAAQEARMGPNSHGQPTIAIEMSRTYEISSDPDCMSGTSTKYDDLGEVRNHIFSSPSALLNQRNPTLQQEKGLTSPRGGVCPMRKVFGPVPFENAGGHGHGHGQHQPQQVKVGLVAHNPHHHPGANPHHGMDLGDGDGGKCPMATAFSFSK
ncbi:hypothetical protein BDV98DRAFT_218259 [Pterulicium gracile]|uniref:DUF6534 domain-containing protein n=1 Tax=Pterulicium gracile TaxID=1884261 RepID=A0A5C3Q8G5_9AGAR|nr:hypothetical protein BDV98DRAFT_218259 [Pterula gracilis]